MSSDRPTTHQKMRSPNHSQKSDRPTTPLKNTIVPTIHKKRDRTIPLTKTRSPNHPQKH